MAWQKVLDSGSLGEGQSVEILLGGNIVAIFRHAGELFAIDGVCMHQGGPLARGKLANGTVQCPWHGWMYELKTGNNAVTCQPMLRTYPIQEGDGRIEIDFDS